MDLSMQSIVAGLVLGAVGMGYLSYGKKLSRPVHIGAGVALIVLPYFLTALLPLLIVSALLIALPLVLRWL
jgi:hypothetical protein